MDQKLPKDKLPVKPAMQIVRLTPTQMPRTGEPFYRGTLPIRPTLSIEDLAKRVVSKRSSFRQEILVAAFRTMIDEMYDATLDGFNVDIGILRSEAVVQGKFNSEHGPFDKKQHSLRIRFHPSPLLKQLVERVPCEVQSGLFGNGPLVAEASILNHPYRNQPDDPCPFNTLPAYYNHPIYLHGRYLKVDGEHPSVGITFRRQEDGQTLFITPREIVINTTSTLCFLPKEKLGPGTWEATVVTQLNCSYHKVQSPRIGRLVLTVSDDPLP